MWGFKFVAVSTPEPAPSAAGPIFPLQAPHRWELPPPEGEKLLMGDHDAGRWVGVKCPLGRVPHSPGEWARLCLSTRRVTVMAPSAGHVAGAEDDWEWVDPRGESVCSSLLGR